jgi:uncharacterized protein YggE
MRKFMNAASPVLCSLFAAVPATADSPASLPPLAPGEVLLEISAYGVARPPATSATFTARSSADAESDEEARRTVADRIARVTTAARGAGVAAGDILAGPVETDRSYGALYANSMDMNVTDGFDSGTPSYSASATVTFVSRTPSAAPGLARSLSAIEGVEPGTAQYRLDDDRAARRTARAEAIRNARTDAESYAAAMGMRIVRVLRVTERTGFDSLPIALTEENVLARGLREGPGGLVHRSDESGEIETYAIVGVDYALAPAR